MVQHWYQRRRSDCARPAIPSQETVTLDEIAAKMGIVAGNANDSIVQVQGELGGISGDARNLLANLNSVIRIAATTLKVIEMLEPKSGVEALTQLLRDMVNFRAFIRSQIVRSAQIVAKSIHTAG
jgi:hypothetical protein